MTVYGVLTVTFIGEILQPRLVPSYNGRTAVEAICENRRRILDRGERVNHVNRLLVRASGSLAENILNNWCPGATAHLQGELSLHRDRAVMQANSLYWIDNEPKENAERLFAEVLQHNPVATDNVISPDDATGDTVETET